MLKSYLKNTSGNFATMFALASTTLLLGVGIAIDYSGIQSHERHLQNMADAAVLYAAKSLKEKPAELKREANKSVNENNIKKHQIKRDLKVTDEGITVELQSNYDTFLMGMFGKKRVSVRVEAEAPFASTEPLNLALVLDTTGSMQGANMDVLKKATTNLLDTIERIENDKILVSLVPFSNYVSVDPAANRSKAWTDVPADYSVPQPDKCHKPLISKSGCTTETKTDTWGPSTSYNDGVPSTNPGGSRTYDVETCTNYEYGPEVCTPQPDKEYKWYGVMGSRDSGDHAKVGYDGKAIPGFLEDASRSRISPVHIQPLTNDYKKLKTTVANFVANGETYIPAGLMWGWRTLTVAEPFTEAKANQSDEVVNALVLMSDGKNTKSLTAPRHDGTDETAANKLTAETCQAIKDDDILVFTVAYKFDADAKATRKILEDCASENTYFFYAKDANGLEAAFDRIAMELYSVRLSG